MSIDEELKTYLQVLWLYKWIIAACAIIASVVALAISLQLTPLYSAVATVRVASAPGGASDYSYSASATRLSNTYVEIATSDIILNKVAERLGLEKQPGVEVDIVPETELIEITASDPDPARARDIANTLASLLVEQSTQLYGGDSPTARQILEGQLQQAKLDLDTVVAEYDRALRAAQSSANPASRNTPIPNPDVDMLGHLVSVRQGIYGDLLQRYEAARTSEELRANAITIVEPAYLPQKPASPKIPLNTALGLLAGLVAGVILAFAFEGMDTTLRGIEDVQALTTFKILCRIPELKRKDRFPHGDNPPAQAFDQLGARLLLFDAGPKPVTFLITSPEPGSGKSTIAANLAVSLTREGNRVVLADMDFRRPSQHTIMQLPNEKGLSNFLCDEIPLDETLQTTKRANLHVVTAGSNLDVPLDWLAPVKIHDLLKSLGKECDYLLVDAPALLSVADPIVLAAQVDAVIVVVARRETKRQDFSFALQQLAEVEAKVVGIVVNKVPNSKLYNYYSRKNTGSRFHSGVETATTPTDVHNRGKVSDLSDE
jgi:polysaccharide biosynthesis transport protein